MQIVNRDKDRLVLKLIRRKVFKVNRRGEIFRCKRKLPGKNEYVKTNPHLINGKANGYIAVGITFETGKYSYIRGHRLVWMYFNKKLIPEGNEINHKDGNKSNNARENLELVTRAENTRLGKSSKLDDKKVKTIKELLNRGLSQTNIAEKFNVCPKTISCIQNNLIWKNV